jgi:hypothetical protein
MHYVKEDQQNFEIIINFIKECGIGQFYSLPD